MSIPMMHKTDSGLRPYYLHMNLLYMMLLLMMKLLLLLVEPRVVELMLELVIRYQDMKEMGLDPK